MFIEVLTLSEFV